MKLFFLSLLVSCSYTTHQVKLTKRPSSQGWFSHERFRLEESPRRAYTHAWMEMGPGFENFKFWALPETLRGEKSLYQRDLLTGRRYHQHSFCPQEDVWEHYGGSIRKAPLTLGQVPGLIHKSGRPQTVLIIENPQQADPSKKEKSLAARKVRLIGGVMEQECLSYPCRGNWSDKLLLVAVEDDDAFWSDVHNLSHLKSKTNWRLIKAFLENYKGKFKVIERYYPRYRLASELSPKEALRKLKKESRQVSLSELTKLKQQCFQTYQKVDQKIQSLSGRKATQYLTGHFSELRTCLSFVYPSNINHDRDHHWRWYFMTAAVKLHQQGYAFDCQNKYWLKSEVKNFVVGPELKSCQELSKKTFFETAVTKLSDLGKVKSKFLSYKEYDNHGLGTHEKVYSWIWTQRPIYSCEYEASKAESPEKVTWKD